MQPSTFPVPDTSPQLPGKIWWRIFQQVSASGDDQLAGVRLSCRAFADAAYANLYSAPGQALQTSWNGVRAAHHALPDARGVVLGHPCFSPWHDAQDKTRDSSAQAEGFMSAVEEKSRPLSERPPLTPALAAWAYQEARSKFYQLHRALGLTRRLPPLSRGWVMAQIGKDFTVRSDAKLTGKAPCVPWKFGWPPATLAVDSQGTPLIALHCESPFSGMSGCIQKQSLCIAKGPGHLINLSRHDEIWVGDRILEQNHFAANYDNFGLEREISRWFTQARKQQARGLRAVSAEVQKPANSDRGDA